ncbi:hypothetical protein PBS_10670 [Paraburkholderia sp. 2C]
MQQAHVQMRFELAYRLAHRLRREAGFDGGAAEAARAHDREKERKGTGSVHCVLMSGFDMPASLLDRFART